MSYNNVGNITGKTRLGATTTNTYTYPAAGSTKPYLFIDGQRIGMRMQTTSPAAVSWQVYVQDHQGSVAVVTDAVGAVVQRLSYDAWGRRRQPNGTEDPSGAITAPTSRGYTDHEHIPGVDLINMNGRVYDPEIARMVSADPLIPELFNTQALNRYSYVYNNPGTFTDPSGYCIDGVSTLACKVIISSAITSIGNFLFGKDKDEKKSAPPPHHAPGLATANEDLRQAEPLRDVSVAESDTLLNAGVAAATLAGGKTSLGGAKFLNGAESEAFDYASQDDGLSLGDKAHLVLGTISIGLDATGIGAAVSWVPDLIDAGVSVAQRDMAGAGMSVGAMIPGIGNVANAAKIGKVAARGSTAVSTYRYTQPGEKFIRYESANPAFSRVTPSGGVRPGAYAAPASDGLTAAGQRVSRYNLPDPNIPRPNYVELAPPAGTPIIGPRPVMGGTGNEVIFPFGF